MFPFCDLLSKLSTTRGRKCFDRRLFFGEQTKRLTIGIERLKATAAAKDEAQAAVGAG
jgi:hypothetical protein